MQSTYAKLVEEREGKEERENKKKEKISKIIYLKIWNLGLTQPQKVAYVTVIWGIGGNVTSVLEVNWVRM